VADPPRIVAEGEIPYRRLRGGARQTSDLVWCWRSKRAAALPI